MKSVEEESLPGRKKPMTAAIAGSSSCESSEAEDSAKLSVSSDLNDDEVLEISENAAGYKSVGSSVSSLTQMICAFCSKDGQQFKDKHIALSAHKFPQDFSTYLDIVRRISKTKNLKRILIVHEHCLRVMNDIKAIGEVNQSLEEDLDDSKAKIALKSEELGREKASNKRKIDDLKKKLSQQQQPIIKRGKHQGKQKSLYMRPICVKLSQLSEKSLNPRDLENYKQWSMGKKPSRMEIESKWKMEIEAEVRKDLQKAKELRETHDSEWKKELEQKLKQSTEASTQKDVLHQQEQDKLNALLKEKDKQLEQLKMQQLSVEKRLKEFDASVKKQLDSAKQESSAELARLKDANELALKDAENRNQNLKESKEAMESLNLKVKAELSNANSKLEDFDAEKCLAQRELLEKTNQWKAVKEKLAETEASKEKTEKELKDAQRAIEEESKKIENKLKAAFAEKEEMLQTELKSLTKKFEDKSELDSAKHGEALKAWEKKLSESEALATELRKQVKEITQSRDTAIKSQKKSDDELKQLKEAHDKIKMEKAAIEVAKGTDAELKEKLVASINKIQSLEKELEKKALEYNTLKTSYDSKFKNSVVQIGEVTKQLNKALLEKKAVEKELKVVGDKYEKTSRMLKESDDALDETDKLANTEKDLRLKLQKEASEQQQNLSKEIARLKLEIESKTKEHQIIIDTCSKSSAEAQELLKKKNKDLEEKTSQLNASLAKCKERIGELESSLDSEREVSKKQAASLEVAQSGHNKLVGDLNKQVQEINAKFLEVFTDSKADKLDVTCGKTLEKCRSTEPSNLQDSVKLTRELCNVQAVLVRAYQDSNAKYINESQQKKAEIQSLESKYQEKAELVKKTDSVMSSLKEIVDKSKKSSELLSTELEKLKKEKETAANERAEVEKRCSTSEAAVSELKKKMSTQDDHITKITKELESTKTEANSLNEQLQGLKKELQENESTLKRYEATLNTLSEFGFKRQEPLESSLASRASMVSPSSSTPTTKSPSTTPSLKVISTEAASSTTVSTSVVPGTNHSTPQLIVVSPSNSPPTFPSSSSSTPSSAASITKKTKGKSSVPRNQSATAVRVAPPSKQMQQQQQQNANQYQHAQINVNSLQPQQLRQGSQIPINMMRELTPQQQQHLQYNRHQYQQQLQPQQQPHLRPQLLRPNQPLAPSAAAQQANLQAAANLHGQHRVVVRQPAPPTVRTASSAAPLLSMALTNPPKAVNHRPPPLSAPHGASPAAAPVAAPSASSTVGSAASPDTMTEFAGLPPAEQDLAKEIYDGLLEALMDPDTESGANSSDEELARTYELLYGNIIGIDQRIAAQPHVVKSMLDKAFMHCFNRKPPVPTGKN